MMRISTAITFTNQLEEEERGTEEALEPVEGPVGDEGEAGSDSLDDAEKLPEGIEEEFEGGPEV